MFRILQTGQKIGRLRKRGGLEAVSGGWAQMFENGFINKWGEGEKSSFSN